MASRIVRTIIVLIIIIIFSSVVVMLHLLWHWRKSHTLWEVRKWVNELSLFVHVMIEGAAVTKFAFTILEEVFARFGLVV